MATKTPYRRRAEEHYKAGAQSLQKCLPGKASERVGELNFPDFSKLDGVQVMINELEKTLEEFSTTNLERLNNKLVGKREKIRRVVLGWFRASYPFASLFLSVAQAGSSVLPVYGNFSETLSYQLSILTVCYVRDWNIAYVESRKAEEIDSIILFLSSTIQRVHLIDSFPPDVAVPQLEAVRCAALLLSGAIMDYLSSAILHLKKGLAVNILKAIFVGTVAYENACKNVEQAVTTYTASIVDLGTAVGIALLLQSRHNEDLIERQFARMSLSTDTNFQTLKEVTSDGFNKILQEYNERETQEVAERFQVWLSKSNSENEREKRMNLRFQTESPPSWVLELDVFKEWIDCDSSRVNNRTLWLSGTTGFGKSVLAAYVIEQLRGMFPSALTMFFFCKNTELLNNPYSLIRTFLHQATVNSRDAFKCLKAIWQKEKEFGGFPETLEDIKEFFDILVSPALDIISLSCRKLFFVIDGINECPRASVVGILKFLQLLHITNQNIRILVTCQRSPEIIAGLKTAVNLELQKGDNANNIQTFVENQLLAHPELRQRFEYVQVNPHHFFQERHNGMFLWVTAVFRCLRDSDSDDDFVTILREVPGSMKVVFEKELKRLELQLDEKEKQWVKEILSWIVVAKRSLRITELELGMRISHRIKNRKRRLPKIWSIERTLSRCGAFVHVSRHENAEESTVSLLHESFKFFITGQDRAGCGFYINSASANSFVMKVCTSYLCSEVVQSDADRSLQGSLNRFETRYPLFAYASLYWQSHGQTAITLDAGQAEIVQDIALGFCERRHLLNLFRGILAVVQIDPSHLKQFRQIPYIVSWFHGQTQHNLRNSATRTSAALNELEQQCYNVEREVFERTLLVVAEVWLSVEPRYKRESCVAFTTLRRLLEGQDYDGSVEGALQWVEAQVDAALDNIWNNVHDVLNHPNGLVNVGHAHALQCWNAKELASAAKCYLLAISFLEDVQAIISVLYELSRALIRLFSHNGDKDALNEAIIAAEEAVEATPDDHQDWPMYAEGLAMSLLCKFTEDESIVDMNKAIAIGRKILARTSEESPEFADRADLLAVGVTYRYQITGDKDHIADAVAMWEKVVTRNAGRDPNKLAERQFFLGRSLAALHFSTACEVKLPKEWDKLDEAIRWMKKSLQLMHPKHPGYLEGLESLHSMVILRASYHQALPKSPHIDSRKSPDDREELAHLYLQASRVHPSLSKYCGYALWWQRQYKAAIHFLEMPTQHRDEGAHDTSCGDCKTEPLKGIRYRCELCFNYDLCQACFGRHAPNSQHKFRPIVSRSSKQIPLIQPLLPPNTSLNPSIFTRVF